MCLRFNASVLVCALAAAALVSERADGQTPLGTAFTFQGQLKNGGSPAGGIFNMVFKLWNDPALSAPINQVGPTLTFDGVGGNPPPVNVTNGLFTVPLDFGAAYNGDKRWLEITVSGTTLSPRQELTAAPHARFSTAPWATSSANISNTNTGNVGIGTAAPGNKLEVTAASNGDGIRLTGTTAPLRSPGYQLYDSATQRGTLGLAEGATAFSTDAVAGDIVLRSNTGKLLLQNGTGAAAMAISGNNVGIGTISPENTLHVMKASAGSITGNSNAPLIVENNTNTFINILAPDANEQGILFGKPAVGSAAGGIIYDSPSTTDGLQFRVNGNSTKMVLDAAGQLGLGTLTPEQTLEVTGANPAVRVTGDDTNIARLEIRNTGSGSIPIPIGRLDFIRGTNPPISITVNNIGGSVMQFEMPLGTPVAYIAGGGLFSCNGNISCGGSINGDAGLSVDGGVGSFPVATFNRVPDDGVIVNLRQAGSTEGTISVSGSTVSYNAFTGSHYAWTHRPLVHGTLVTLTGENRRLRDDSESEIIYGIARSSAANDPKCLGAYLGLQQPSQSYGKENPHLVMAVGNGEMWVVDDGEDILPGDYLISSAVAGCAMKDDPERFAVGHIVARAAERVDWGHSSVRGGGPARKKISVLFGNFVRGNQSTALEKRVASQDERISELETQIRSMQSSLTELQRHEARNDSVVARVASGERSGS